MFRLTACLLCLATPLAAMEKAQMCAVTAEIAGAVVSERSDGAEKTAAIEAVSGSLDEDNTIFLAAVQPIADWVYTLPEDQLTDQVAVSYEDACLVQ